MKEASRKCNVTLLSMGKSVTGTSFRRGIKSGYARKTISKKRQPVSIGGANRQIDFDPGIFAGF
jgi:hypothetical protein